MTRYLWNDLWTELWAGPDAANLVGDKIRSFEHLPNGWHFGEGEPVSGPQIERALAVLDIGRTLGLKSDAFATENGNVIVSFYDGEKSIDVEVCGDNVFSLVYEEGIGATYRETDQIAGADIAEVRNRLSQFDPWNMLDSFTFNTMTPEEDDSLVQSFDLQATVVASHWLNCVVSETKTSQAEFARTYVITTAA
ncbi:MAG: hypothetical protein ACC655_07005 [Rhodothermia bacterium]